MKSECLSVDLTSLKLADFKTPQMICLINGSGGGSKLLQSYLDKHPEIYNIPAFPMLYFYPHWDTWEKEFSASWTWETIIEQFCHKHASVIDSRRILGINGLDKLGENQDEYIKIDENNFKSYLKSLLQDEPIKRKSFLLAVHYAYAMCKNEDMSSKSVLLWPHHVYEFLDDFIADFQDAFIFAMIRDPRPKIYSNFKTYSKTDQIKLNETDAEIYKAFTFYNVNNHYFDHLHTLKLLADPNKIHFIRHEDLALRLEEVMRSIARLVNIEFGDHMLKTTFDGKWWWGHEVYSMPKVTGTYKRVLSTKWKKKNPKIEIFILEGIFLDFYHKYNYEILYYNKDSVWNRVLLSLAILWPFSVEWKVLLFYLNPFSHVHFLYTAFRESAGKVKFKDYSWNASYRYKWLYLEHKLWRRNKCRKFCDYANALSQNNKFSPLAIGAVVLSHLLYIGVQYGRFLISMIKLPILYTRRLGIYYRSLGRRLRKQTFLAQNLR